MAEPYKEVHYFATSLIGCFTAFSFWQLIKNQYNISTRKMTARKIKKSEISSPSGLKAEDVNNTVVLRGNVAYFDQPGSRKNRNMAINISPNKAQPLALRISFKQCIYSNQSFNQNKVNYKINLQKVLKDSVTSYVDQIYLADQQVKQRSVLLKNLDGVDYSRVLQVLKWDEKRRSLSLGQEINVLLLSILRALATIGVQDRNVTLIRGLDVGVREVDAGIKIGATISVLGTVGITLDGMIFIEPMWIFKDRLSFLKEIESEVQSYVEKRNWWLVGFLIGGVYLARRLYHYCQKNGIVLPWLKKKPMIN